MKQQLQELWKKTRGVPWVIWVGACFFLATLLASGLAYATRPLWLGADQTLLEAVFSAIVYITLLLVVLGVPYVWQKHQKSRSEDLPKLLGVNQPPKWRNLAQAVATYLVYMGILIVVMLALNVVIRAVGPDSWQGILTQEQEVGFSKTGNSLAQLVLIFAALVVIPAVCEELVMRGFLLGKLGKQLPFWVSAVLVSLLFAILHGQINVGIDTFVLSLVLCYARRETGSIWTGIFAHMLKNGLAFALLFTNWLKLW